MDSSSAASPAASSAISSDNSGPPPVGQYTQPSHLLSNIHHLLNVKLDPTNYHLWRSQFLPIFRAHDLMGHLDGTLPQPSKLLTDGRPNPQYLHFFKQDQLILSWIISSLTEGVLDQVLSHESAASIWNALTMIFASNSQARIQQLELQLRSLKKGTSSMADFIQTIKKIAHQLAVAGSHLSDQQLIICLLSGLGSDYAALAASVTSRLEPMTLDEFTGILLNHDLLFRPPAATDNNAPLLANNAILDTPTRENSTGAFRHHGRGQGKFSGRGRGRGRSPVTCQLCNRPGHLAVNCYHQNNFSSYPPTRPPRPNSAPSSNLSVTSSTPDPRVLDSGATHHITHDLANLQVSSPYHGHDNVQVGNGADVPIHNTGQGYWHRTSPWDS